MKANIRRDTKLAFDDAAVLDDAARTGLFSASGRS